MTREEIEEHFCSDCPSGDCANCVLYFEHIMNESSDDDSQEECWRPPHLYDEEERYLLQQEINDSIGNDF